MVKMVPLESQKTVVFYRQLYDIICTITNSIFELNYFNVLNK